MHLLLDPGFWRPRLERLAQKPRQLAIFPRPDLERPGIEVLELRMRAHDDQRLSALLARSAFCAAGERVKLHVSPCLAPSELDWTSVERGVTDLVFCYPGSPGERRLEDRVMDVLRVSFAACALESVGIERVSFADEPRAGSPPAAEVAAEPSEPNDPAKAAGPDEFAIARFFRLRGWV